MNARRISLIPVLVYLVLLAWASAGQTDKNRTAVATTDKFGATDVHIGKATGFFRAEKNGNRWILITPNGGAFWTLRVDELCSSGCDEFS